MHEEAPSGRRHGTVAVLALLLSVLLSAANAPAARIGADGRSSAIGQAEKGKSGALLRTAGRHAAGEQEEDSFSAAPGARVETRLGAVRPLPETHAALSSARVTPAGIAYRARAPPAAA